MTSLLNLMHNFQKLNKVTKQCITNTQYFYDNFMEFIEIAKLINNKNIL